MKGLGVSDVLSIEEAEQIEERKDRYESQIDTADDALCSLLR